MKEGIKRYIEFEIAALTREGCFSYTQKLTEDIALEKWNFEDVLELLKEVERKNVFVRQPLFEHIIHPILKSEINTKNVEAIKVAKISDW